MAGDQEGEGCAVLQLAWFSFQSGGQIEAGLEQAATAKRLFKALGRTDGEAAATSMEAWLLVEAGLTEEASEESRAALSLLTEASHPSIRGFVTNVLGVVLWCCRQIDQAIPYCEEAVRLATQAPDPLATAWWRINLAGVHAAIGYRATAAQRSADAARAFAIAIDINAQALAGAAACGDHWCHHLALCNAAEYLCAARRIDEALAQLALCDTIPWTPLRRSRTHYLSIRAETLIVAGRAGEARPLCEESLRLAEQAGDIEACMQSLRSLSTVHEKAGAHKKALVSFKRFFDHYQMLANENAQRHARLTGIRYETHRLREKADAAEAKVASLVLTSRSDALTGLANRRALDKTLAELDGQSYALALLDLDRFKLINDRFSHMVGDAVLRQVGAFLAGCGSTNVTAARLGGEEFVLVMPETDRAAAVRLCEALRIQIATYAWQRHHPKLKVTTSIGIACHTEASDPQATLSLADDRLYQAKNLGRNRVVATSNQGLRHPTGEIARAAEA